MTGLAVLVVAVLAAVGALRLKSEIPPVLQVRRDLPAAVRFPGPAPTLDWPAHGEAAAEVEGLGRLGAVGGDTPVPIASVAKVMTAYLVLRDHPLAPGGSGFHLTITPAEVSDQAARAAQGQSTLPVVAGEQLTEYQLLEALLVPSANNVAAILATYDAGSQGAFVARMNATARALGMDRTTYTDPSGFMSSTVSTASDQLRLAVVAMRNPVFARIVGLPSVTLPVAGKLDNYDRLAGRDGFVGVKTGSDASAGGCFVFADDRTVDGHAVSIVGVVLGQDRGVESTDTIINAALVAARNLARSIRSSLAVRTVLPTGTAVLTFVNAQGREVSAVTRSGLTSFGWGGLTVPLSLSTASPRRALAAGQDVATVGVGGMAPGRTRATATATMPPLTLRWRLAHVI